MREREERERERERERVAMLRPRQHGCHEIRHRAKYGIPGSTTYRDIPESTKYEIPGNTRYEEVWNTEALDARYHEVPDMKKHGAMPGITRCEDVLNMSG